MFSGDGVSEECVHEVGNVEVLFNSPTAFCEQFRLSAQVFHFCLPLPTVPHLGGGDTPLQIRAPLTFNGVRVWTRVGYFFFLVFFSCWLHSVGGLMDF